MSANDDLRLAWQAHRAERIGRRDALLTLAVAAAEPEGAEWVGRVRDFLVASRPDHLYAGFYHLDEALGDRRVDAALKRLRDTFPPARVRWLLRASNVARGPYTGRNTPVEALIDEMLAPKRSSRRPVQLGSAKAASGDAAPVPAEDPSAPILAFYMQVLLAIATLCAIVLAESQDSKRAA